MKKFTLFSLLFLFCFTAINAQNTELILENSVKPHKGIDAIYKTFSDGYRYIKA